MDPESPAVRTLRRAAATVGESALATALGVSRETLTAWLSGVRMPPVEAYVKALDIFANGPLWKEAEPNQAASSGRTDSPDERGC